MPVQTAQPASEPALWRRTGPDHAAPRPVIDLEAEFIHSKPRVRQHPLMMFLAALVLFSAVAVAWCIGLLLLGWAFHT